MPKRMLGVLTAVVAGLLLVGVAWASNDVTGDESTTSTAAASSSTEASTSVTSEQVTSTSVDESSTTSDVEDESSTSTTIDDDDDVTGTSVDDDELDDRDDDQDDDDQDEETKEETRSPAPANSDPKGYEVDGAGTVTVQVVNGALVLIGVSPSDGWSFEIDKSESLDIEVEFRNGESEASFEAKIRDGQLRVEIEAGSD